MPFKRRLQDEKKKQKAKKKLKENISGYSIYSAYNIPSNIIWVHKNEQAIILKGKELCKRSSGWHRVERIEA